MKKPIKLLTLFGRTLKLLKSFLCRYLGPSLLEITPDGNFCSGGALLPASDGNGVNQCFQIRVQRKKLSMEAK